MMIFPHQHFAFYHMNKAGGTSICKMLESLPYKWEQVGKKHTPLSRKDFPEFSEYAVYTNIRNPFSRIVSIYEYRRQFSQRTRFKTVSFNEFFYEYWLAKPLDEFKPQHEYLFLNGKIPENVHCVKLEEAETWWPSIVKSHFGRDVEVPRLNTTAHGDPMGYFRGGMVKAVKTKEWWACGEYGL